MTSRERVIAALNHETPDYVPMDLGGCGQTGISASTLYQLRKAYGLDEHPVKIVEPYQILGEVELDLLEKIGGDVVPLWNRDNLMGISNLNCTKPWTLCDGTPTLMSEDFEYDVDERGYTYVYPCGDRSVKPSLMMTKEGFFFDNIERSEYDEDNLTPLEDYRDSFTVKTEADCEHWEKQIKHIYDTSDYAVFGCLGGMSIGDAAEVPGPFLKNPKGIRGVQDWLMAHLLYPEYVEEVYAYAADVMIKNLELYKQAVGNKIQAIWLSGTDFGTQNAPMHSLNTFRNLYKPYYKKVNDWIHENTTWKTFYHTCGAVAGFMEDFIDMGMDIVNPVQLSAAGMDGRELKAKYGDRITFWGGGVDTQHTLPSGTPEEVYNEVMERLNIFSPNGGFVFATIHNVVAKVPAENLVAMYKAVKDFRGI
ncbi:methyltransferase [Lactonifactor longoviformis]|uniref:Uroporphyrinogen decarboxylase (URO-D) n=1 Tax=Lactonifactor longoviformis DSM 17459 TaxID=1122155 RepID=A0A1M4WC48_9CLOT|nr:uroporphyrinogen decarboxylase family protein [Lactonifactor longoviformis]POP30874.1 methyltransferase [Lactonifactor longoviformis]SHE78814.1 Uroporphyrinogen decarboxylase (URO-D) [Lactonifactor longoviformis DSM 17459]